MKFTKMHGIGNDYVYVNCFKETVRAPVRAGDQSLQATGILASVLDGLILIKPSDSGRL